MIKNIAIVLTTAFILSSCSHNGHRAHQDTDSTKPCKVGQKCDESKKAEGCCNKKEESKGCCKG